MGFGVGTQQPSAMAKTQADLVAERVEAKPDLLEEEVTYPGLQKIHLMGEGELMEFFTTVLKSRVFVRELDLTLGDAYESTEKQVNVPKSNLLHTMEFGDVARVLVMALASGGENCIGFRAVISVDKEGEITSKLYVRTANKPVHGPTYDSAGNIDVEGDPEFSPKMKITSKP
jgi:hypothetical protein